MRDPDKRSDEWSQPYRHLVEEAEDILYLLDADGNYTLVNDTMAELTGYEKEELVGNSPEMVLSDEDLAKGQRRIRHLIASDDRTTDTWTVRLITKEGDRIPCELRFSLLPTDSGDYGGIVGIGRDIRERHRREQKLQVMTRVLRHNIRNKLGVVIGMAELLGERATNEDATLTAEDVVEMSDTIAENAEVMVRLSEKIRTVQERIRAEPEHEPRTEVVRLARGVVEKQRADNPDAEITLDAPNQAWASVADTYEVALSELVENGIMHHDGEGPLSVHVDISVVNDVVVTSVTDNCPPIPEAEKRVIRNQEETTLSHSAGVGLWLVHWVVKAARGQMIFDREADGNRVELCFDAADPL